MSPYLKRIRSLVGRELLLLPSVTVLVFDRSGRVLLALHDGTGRWVAPGGMVEPDESPEAAAIREMREETGCEVELEGILGCFGGPRFRVQYSNGDEAAYVMTVYRGRITSGTPAPDLREVSRVRFVSREELVGMKTAEWLTEVLSAPSVGFA